MKRMALRVLIGSVGLSALLGVYALLAGDFGETEVKILVSSLTVSGTSILAMACGAAWERRRLGSLPPVGVVVAVGSCVLVLGGVWGEAKWDEFWEVTASAGIAAIGCAHVALMSLARLEARFRWTLAAAYLLAFLLAATLIGLVWSEWEGESVWRWIGVLSVLLAATTVVVPVLHRMSRHEAAEAAAARFCPACGASLPQGGESGVCGACGARFRVEFV